MVGLATALVDAGHEVLFATAPPLDAMIRFDGFAVEAVGLSEDQIRELRAMDAVYTEMSAAPRRGRMAAFTRSFAGFEVPPRLDGLRRLVREWRPDLIVYESAEFAGPLAAELDGLPSVHHAFGPLVEAEVMAAAGAVAAAHWAGNGLPEPDRGGMYRGLYLDIVPPSLRPSHLATIPHVQAIRPVPVQGAAAETPPWLLELGSRPVILVTFGTVFNKRLNLYHAVIDGLRGLDADVVITTGRSEAARSLADLPPNIQMHEWVPWAPMLARSSVVVSHGGASSTLGPLAFGLPLVLIPISADHFTNADAAAAAGAATVLDAQTVNGDDLRRAVATAFSEPATISARQIAAEIADMPPPESVVDILASAAAG